MAVQPLLICFILLFGGYAFVEPSDVDATSTSTLVVASLTVGAEISLTPPDAITLSPNITMSNSSSSATGTWNVKTSAAAGYTLSLHASQEDALVATTTGEVFQDCPTSTPDFWNQGCATSTGYVFGFSAYGNAVPTATWGTGGDCGSSGNPSETLEYRGFNSTNDIQIAVEGAGTGAGGTDSTMCLTATQGSSVYAPDGLYQATITGTATTQ